jgi:hypothetical protein
MVTRDIRPGLPILFYTFRLLGTFLNQNRKKKTLKNEKVKVMTLTLLLLLTKKSYYSILF